MAELAWQLDARLHGDTHAVAHWPLSQLLLMDDSRWRWLIVVPRVSGARELIDLPAAQRLQLHEEIDRAARLLRDCYAPDKLNVAALGNVVEQLHVHVIARRRDDAAWPRPVWGVGERTTYDPDMRARTLETLRAAAGCA